MAKDISAPAGWLFVALLALLASVTAVDGGFAIHMGIEAAAAFFVAVRGLGAKSKDGMGPGVSPTAAAHYYDDVIRWGVIATVFWGIVGFLVGVLIAAQLTFPQLNLAPFLNFGRIRPLHTSAVIFAFGGMSAARHRSWSPVAHCRQRRR